ncbi:MAG: (2Fe-2S)-binding protein [Janthinobacterium lividum]
MFRTLHDPVESVTLRIDDVEIAAQPGETVAAVILRQKEIWTRESPINGGRRAPYCMMGVCFECLAEVDGQNSTQTCLTIVREGMQVRRQRRRPEIAG